jgi:hypothetical protein
VELTLLQRRGTGMPNKRNRQVHAILSHSMNIASVVSLILKLPVSYIETFSERYVYMSTVQTVIILTYNCKGNDVFRRTGMISIEPFTPCHQSASCIRFWDGAFLPVAFCSIVRSMPDRFRKNVHRYLFPSTRYVFDFLRQHKALIVNNYEIHYLSLLFVTGTYMTRSWHVWHVYGTFSVYP